ncbi:MAG: L,D-transpeptidase family protein [Muribaculaceae bacterium]|nr:L,D-transpeptidase family protein [Muribaculaceae bacterium]
MITVCASFAVTMVGIGSCARCNGKTKPAKGQFLEIYDVVGSAGKARLTIDDNEVWVTDVFVGQNGLGKKREGDRKTPLGEIHIKGAFGILPNPGTTIDYTLVTPSIFACGDREYYNQVIDTAVVHHPNCHGEDMYHMGPDYNYGLMTDYNKECVYGLGGSIFIHCKGNKPYTAGCIAFDEDRMIDILKLCDSTLLVTVRK